MHTAHPVLLVLTDRLDLSASAADRRERIDVHATKTGDRPADALLIRPDRHVAWATATAADEPADTAAPALREALTTWLGTHG